MVRALARCRVGRPVVSSAVARAASRSAWAFARASARALSPGSAACCLAAHVDNKYLKLLTIVIGH
jgi:hypothetical protein